MIFEIRYTVPKNIDRVLMNELSCTFPSIRFKAHDLAFSCYRANLLKSCS